MPEFSLILHFPVSRSKFYDGAVKLARHFDNFTVMNGNVVSVSMKEVFEKWDYFNLLFWAIVDWKGSILEYEQMKYHSHSDKTRIFYALQLAHIKHICYIEAKISQLDRVQIGECKYSDLDFDNMPEIEMNNLIEYYNIIKTKADLNLI